MSAATIIIPLDELLAPRSVDRHRMHCWLRDAHLQAHRAAGDTGAGKYTVPVLWDTQSQTIVNNESLDIIDILDKDLNSIAKNPELDLKPAALVKQLDELNKWIYPHINNGCAPHAAIAHCSLLHPTVRGCIAHVWLDAEYA